MKIMTIVRYLVFSSIVFLFAVHVPLLFAQDIQTKSAASKTENDELKAENDKLKEQLLKFEQIQNKLALEIEKIKSIDKDNDVKVSNNK